MPTRPEDPPHPRAADAPPSTPLGRLGRAFRSQHWFTVFLELVILVVGVFLGIQVSNWNEERAFRAQEASYLRQLRDEIQANRRAIEYQDRYVRSVVAGGRKALAFLEGDGGCTSECEELLVDFFHSSHVWGSTYGRTTWEELIRLGMPTDEGVRAAAGDFYFFLDGWSAVNATPPPYRVMVRGHVSPDVAEVLWHQCYELFNGGLEVLTHDCVDDLPSSEVVVILQRLRATPGIAEALRFWIGQNIVALSFYADMLADAEKAITALDGAVGVEG